MIEKQLSVINQKGLHARACSVLATLANTFKSSINIHFGQQTADAKNILQLMMLAAAKGSTLIMYCSGEDETEAATAIDDLFAQYFGEEN